jgi:hypothetical protein
MRSLGMPCGSSILAERRLFVLDGADSNRVRVGVPPLAEYSYEKTRIGKRETMVAISENCGKIKFFVNRSDNLAF